MFVRLDGETSPEYVAIWPDKKSWEAPSIHTIADEAKVPVVVSRAHCRHGYTRDELCVDCEGGYGTDSATYFRPRGSYCLAEAGDDGDAVYYVSSRYWAKVHKAIERLGGQL